MNSKVQQAVAAVLALGAAAGAQAIDITGAVTPLYVSGSTAIDPGLKAFWLDSVQNYCDPAQPIDYYAGTQSGVKFTAVACVGGTFSTNAGQNIAYIKEDNAGSLNGITPVNAATAIPFPNISLMTVANCPTAAGTGSGLNPYTSHTCGAAVTAVNIAPNLGFADVEAALFNAGSIPNLTQFSSVDTIFAPAVSLGLYHALQSLQGLTQDDAVADIPTLSRGQLYSIFQGQVTPTLVKNSASTSSLATASVAFGTSSGASICGTNPTCTTTDTANLYICQRGQSSGTEQTSQVFFGDIGCSSGVPKFQAPGKPGGTCAADGCGWSSTFNTVVNFAGAGTGDVLSCLQAHDALGHLAIGFASVDNGWGVYQSNTARKDFRYTRVDGVVPSIENVASDRYGYWAQSSGYKPATSASNYPSTVVGQNILTSFSNKVGPASSVSALNTAFQYTAPAFDGGFLAIPGNAGAVPNASSASVASFRSNPVNSFLRSNPPNNCQPPALSTAAGAAAPDTSNYPTWQTP